MKTIIRRTHSLPRRAIVVSEDSRPLAKALASLGIEPFDTKAVYVYIDKMTALPVLSILGSRFYEGLETTFGLKSRRVWVRVPYSSYTASVPGPVAGHYQAIAYKCRGVEFFIAGVMKVRRYLKAPDPLTAMKAMKGLFLVAQCGTAEEFYVDRLDDPQV